MTLADPDRRTVTENSTTIERIAPVVTARGAQWTLLCGEPALCWATGIVTQIEAGSSPFRGGPPLILIPSSGHKMAVVASNTELTTVDHPDLEVLSYVGFGVDPTVDQHANYLAAFDAALAATGVIGAVGVTPADLPADVADVLTRHGHPVIDVSADLDRLRAVKADNEVHRLRRSAAIASLAQQAAFATARAGMSELELFSVLRLAAEQEAGQRLPFTGDLVTGVARTAAVGGWPTARQLQVGDPVIADLAPRVDGYWADSCNTFTVGPASPEIALLHDKVARALHIAEAIATPGTPVGEIDRVVRQELARDHLGYPHHTGHGIGTSVHEWPRIIPGETAALEPGMVILLEPGAYQNGVGGVRLERMYLVTGTGLECLTPFDQHLEQHTPVADLA